MPVLVLLALFVEPEPEPELEPVVVSVPVPLDVVDVVEAPPAPPIPSSVRAPHELPSAPTAVRPRSTAAAVRGTLPSLRRRGSPQLGQVTSALFAWQ